MAENLEILNTAASLLIRAVLLAARFSARARRGSRERLAARDIDAKAKEILLLKIEDRKPSGTPAHKTPTEMASLVWEITKASLSWGRIRITNQLRLRGIFLSASTVRNILQRPKPRNTPTTPAATTEKTEDKPEACSIPAWYPNHVWSVDTTKVRCWGLWSIHARAADR